MASSAKSPPPPSVKQDTLAYWVNIASALGFARTVGEIYGLLFLSEIPLSADDLVEELGISRSGAGQGLKTLQEIGAIKAVHVLANRKEHYQMQTDLGVLVKLLLNARILPKLEELSQQRAALDASVRSQEGPAHLVQRFDKLDRWSAKTTPLIALLKSFSA